MVALTIGNQISAGSGTFAQETLQEGHGEASALSRFMSEMYVVDGRSFSTLAAAVAHLAASKAGAAQ